MKKQEKKSTEKLQKGSEGPKESQDGLDRYPVQGD